MTQIGCSQWSACLKFRIFENPRWRRPLSRKSENRYIAATEWPVFAKFGKIMQNVLLTVQNPRWRTAVKLISKSVNLTYYLRISATV